jgi:hypothetical protein
MDGREASAEELNPAEEIRLVLSEAEEKEEKKRSKK